MRAPGRWIAMGSLIVAFAFIAPGIAAAAPAGFSFPTLEHANVVSTSTHGSGGHGGGGGGGGHGGGGGSTFSCPTISGAGQSVCSTNWAGWADTGPTGSVTTVSGTWTVPTVSCSGHGTSYDAIWIGIDGYSSSTVEQTGILGVCSHGTATYSAWYEFYPAGMVAWTSQSIAPGDSVSASVTFSSGTYSVRLSVNGGTVHTASATVAGAQGTSAEWIVERPALCTVSCRLSTLADFTTTTFTGASATVSGTNGGIGAFSDVAMTMVGGSSGPILAQPSPLASSGTSFSVVYG